MIKSPTSQTGAIGESIAREYLASKGYRILECNYRRPWGEIDIIASHGDVVHFVEVKSVSRSLNASRENISREMDHRPEEVATTAKLRKVARTAAAYMEAKGDSRGYQIDVLGVIMDPEKRMARCRFFEQVLE